MRTDRRGFSIIELLVVVSIMLILITVAVPQFQKAQTVARETAAVRTIGTIHAAEVQYQAQYGRFASSLAELGPPASGGDGAHGAALISRKLANGKSSGYRFSLRLTGEGYAIEAVPESAGRRFFSNEKQTIHESRGAEPATENSPEIDR